MDEKISINLNLPQSVFEALQESADFRGVSVESYLEAYILINTKPSLSQITKVSENL